MQEEDVDQLNDVLVLNLLQDLDLSQSCKVDAFSELAHPADHVCERLCSL
jgi:hypothetical protein